MTLALAWLKRDLRCRDHAPLAALASAEAAAALFVIEPAWLASPECAGRHLAHTLAALGELRATLAARGLPLLVKVGPVAAVFDELRRTFPFTELHSHEETGPGWSFERDRAVARWARARGVAWFEHTQTGVVRRLKDRRGWAGRWQQRMDAPEVAMPAGWRGAALPLDDLPTLASLGPLGVSPDALAAAPWQGAGEAEAQATLASFLAGRGREYRRHLSSPLTAEDSCSRLSAHLAFGSLSLRQVHQATEAAIARAQAEGDRGLAYGLRGFAGRLRWHCHFMQKLEDEPAIEHRNFARVCDGLRPGDGLPIDDAAAERLAAWQAGRTGFPMVDACMRQLNATGWLNFRMRALLVSFAAYHLWLHWRAPGLHLARQFVDFEAGIHWSQMQMQSGTTGINTLRIYSPGKQQRDHDPDFAYIRRWVPEWGSDAYPAPIVDEAAAVAHAKQVLYGLRKQPEARREADAVQARHGSRKSGLPNTTKGAKAAQRRTANAPRPAAGDDRQGELF